MCIHSIRVVGVCGDDVVNHVPKWHCCVDICGGDVVNNVHTQHCCLYLGERKRGRETL